MPAKRRQSLSLSMAKSSRAHFLRGSYFFSSTFFQIVGWIDIQFFVYKYSDRILNAEYRLTIENLEEEWGGV
jgi:hypothetical protein